MNFFTSNHAIGTIISQMREEEKLHAIAFYFRKLSTTKNNYEIHNEELLD